MNVYINMVVIVPVKIFHISTSNLTKCQGLFNMRGQYQHWCGEQLRDSLAVQNFSVIMLFALNKTLICQTFQFSSTFFIDCWVGILSINLKSFNQTTELKYLTFIGLASFKLIISVQILAQEFQRITDCSRMLCIGF